jgi:G3E family GTPase
VAAFGWPSIRTRTRVHAVVTVVDGEALAAGHVVGDAAAVEAQRRADPSLDHLRAIEDLFQDQLEAADLVLVSRADRMDGKRLEQVVGQIRPRLRPGTSVLPMARGRVDPFLLLASKGADPSDDPHLRNAPAQGAIDSDHEAGHDHDHDHSTCGHDHSHDHDHAHGHAHDPATCTDPTHDHKPPHNDDIGAFVFKSNKPFDPERLEEFLGGVVQVYGPDLLRYKGILYMKGINRRMLFQGVHMMMGAEPGKPWLASEKKNTKMVFIGRKLPQDIFTKGLEQCLAKS